MAESRPHSRRTPPPARGGQCRQSLPDRHLPLTANPREADRPILGRGVCLGRVHRKLRHARHAGSHATRRTIAKLECRVGQRCPAEEAMRSEEHTSELQSLMRISYAVFCLKKKKKS